MRTISEIRAELEGAIARRTELWETLSRGHDAQASAEAARLSKVIEDLWAEQRALQARLRHGPVDAIQARARAEERLERDTKRLRQAA